MLQSALKRVLEAKGISASELSRKSEVCRVTISLVASGKRLAFSRAAAPKIFRALEGAIPLTVLLGVEQPETAPSTTRRRVARKAASNG